MSDDGLTPLAQMMLTNSDIIDGEIEKYGPSVVAEFFIQAGTAIAAAYGLDESDQSAGADTTEAKEL